MYQKVSLILHRNDIMGPTTHTTCPVMSYVGYMVGS